MSPKVDAFVDRHWKGILGIIVGGIIAWQTLEAKVRGLDEKKADKTTVEPLVQTVGDILYLVCLDSLKRKDSRCNKQ